MPRLHRRTRRAASPTGRPDRVSPHVRFSRRITALTVFFVLVVLLYAVLLTVNLARGNAYAIYVEGPDVPTGGTTETVTVSARRGGIYDRNGLPLVTSRYVYDLDLSYGAFQRVGSLRDRNRLLLSLVEALRDSGAELPYLSALPMDGTYPNLTWSASANASRARVLSRLSLPEDTSAAALVAYYLEAYALDARTDGIPDHTDEQIDALIRIYFDMDANDFGAVAPYTVARALPSTAVAGQLEQNVRCIRISARTERVYHYPGYATHLLGRVGPIYAEDWSYYSAMGYPMSAVVGVEGCEKAFESILRGVDGKMRITLDAQGNTIATEMLEEPIPGNDIRLTIDIQVQKAAEDGMRESGQNGAVVALRADTGELYALACAPSYETESFLSQYDTLVSDPALPLLNRALSSTYEMGELYQLVTATAGLGTGTVHASDLWQDSGTILFGENVPSLSCDQNHGLLSPGSALTEGCHCYFANLGLTLGAKTLTEWEQSLGIGRRTGVELSEAAGQPSGIYPGTELSLAQAAAGQGSAAATPAQLSSMLATVLTGGTRMEAKLLYEVRDYKSGETVMTKTNTSTSTVTLNESAREVLLRAMKNNVEQHPDYKTLAENTGGYGMEFGLLSSVNEQRALLLAFGQPPFGGAPASLAVTVALEGQASQEQCAAIAFAVLAARR